MSNDQSSTATPHLVWVVTSSLAQTLDAATWLDTTRELSNMGWQVTLIGAGPAGKNVIRGVEVLCIPRPDVYLLRQLVFHLRVLRLLLLQWVTIDVILFHHMSAPWIFPLRLWRLPTRSRKPLLVMDTRSLAMTHQSNLNWKERLRRPFYRLVDSLADRLADGRLAITQRLADAIHIPEEKLWGVWPSGVDIDLFTSGQNSKCWPSEGEPIHLIYIGVLHYERNLLTLSHAVERANSEGMSFIFTIVGDGAQRMELEEFASRTDGRIRLIPSVPHQYIPEILAQAHIGVLPFPDEEKFRVSSPIKLFEYMAAGLPIMVTRIACHQDVVGNGNYAFWSDSAEEESLLETLRLIWLRSDYLRKMGGQARLASCAWSWRESANKLRISLEKGLARC